MRSNRSAKIAALVPAMMLALGARTLGIENRDWAMVGDPARAAEYCADLEKNIQMQRELFNSLTNGTSLAIPVDLSLATNVLPQARAETAGETSGTESVPRPSTIVEREAYLREMSLDMATKYGEENAGAEIVRHAKSLGAYQRSYKDALKEQIQAYEKELAAGRQRLAELNGRPAGTTNTSRGSFGGGTGTVQAATARTPSGATSGDDPPDPASLGENPFAKLSKPGNPAEARAMADALDKAAKARDGK